MSEDTQQTLVEKLEHWAVAELVPYARNARTHSATQVTQIARSIEAFGFVNPILVGQDKVIVAGHGRLMAAQRAGHDDSAGDRVGASGRAAAPGAGAG